MVLPIGRCYSCRARSDELQNVDIHTGKAPLCPKCFDEHANAVAIKTRLIEGWQARNRHLSEVYDGFRADNEAEQVRARNHFWRRLFIRLVRAWRWL